MNRKWCLKDNSNLDLDLFPRKEDLSKTLDHFKPAKSNGERSIQSPKKPHPQFPHPPTFTMIESSEQKSQEELVEDLNNVLQNYFMKNIPHESSKYKADLVITVAKN